MAGRRAEIRAARLRPCLRPYAAVATASGTTTHTMPFPGADMGEGGGDVLISFLGHRGRRAHRVSPKENPQLMNGWHDRYLNKSQGHEVEMHQRSVFNDVMFKLKITKWNHCFGTPGDVVCLPGECVQVQGFRVK